MDLAWAHVWITVLTVAAFVLSSIGLWRLRRDSAAGVARMEADRTTRNDLRDKLEAAQGAASTDEERRTALDEWRTGHERAGLEPHTYKAMNDGREFLAERIIRELDSGSKADVVVIGAGLVCGLAASIWGTWLP